MKLSAKQIKYLKGLGHRLRPVVMVGREGIKPGVLKELEATLNCHELIKVKISAEEREDFLGVVGSISGRTQAALVQTIGRVALFYREKPADGPNEQRRPRLSLPAH